MKWDVSTSAHPGGDIEISALDAVTTHLNFSDKPRGIMPWIAIDPNVGELHWRSFSGLAGEISGLHPLDESDCLVGDALTNDSPVASLFHNRRIISVHLDPDQLRAPAMAWETLDALLLTSDEWQKLPAGFRLGLFAEGIKLAVGGVDPPDRVLPWRRLEQWWIVSSELELPPVINAGAYAPTEGWTTGRSVEFRRRIFLFGAIYCLIACGACLWQSRLIPAAFVAISLLAGAAFAFDNARQSPIFHRSGTVLLTGDATLVDHWVYQVSHRPADFRLPVGGFVHPIFSDAEQPERMNLKLDCDADGNPIEIDGHLPSDEPLALMSRRVIAAPGENSAASRLPAPCFGLGNLSIRNSKLPAS